MKQIKITRPLIFLIVVVNLPIAAVLWLTAPFFGAMLTGFLLLDLALCFGITKNWEEKGIEFVSSLLEKAHIIVAGFLEFSLLILLYQQGSFALGFTATLVAVVCLLMYAKKTQAHRTLTKK